MKMNILNKAKVVGLVCISLVISGCATVQLTTQQQVLIDDSTALYTQVGMWTEKGNVIATNYNRGEHIPVNSPVVITDIDASTITFSYAGNSIKLKNIEKFTKVDVSALMTRTFSAEAVNLTQFNALEKKAIKQGDVVIGMSKDAVITSRGFPPAHQTSRLELDSWRFWNNRFGTIIYQFEQDKVVKIVD